tara:strand:+ start:105 stop:422 length:318 start_codon:yes stop_codon:yes gene_type:complete
MARTDLSYANLATAQNQFERLGHPGRITSVLEYTGGTIDFTGSNYGYGAIKVISDTGATASLSGGGSIPLGHFDDTNLILPISIARIHGGAATAKVYIFKVQGTV